MIRWSQMTRAERATRVAEQAEEKRKYARELRAENLRLGRCVNDTKASTHAQPRDGQQKCDACIAKHKKAR